MVMDEAVWARHANPWSVYTRILTGPLLVLAIWSRLWFGWWSVIPIAIMCFLIWYNPRAFPPPRSTDNWASKGTFGERVFLNRHAVPIPKHHGTMAKILSFASAIGLLPLVIGLIKYDVWMTICGMVLIIGGKIWFVDRMVWLYEDMKDQHPDYGQWFRT
ncbi:MAG: hypothetical protein JKY99_07880 [Rhizobiales bacterium]|nr:hypothetical protein [Hyphomicrobiales bacterium]